MRIPAHLAAAALCLTATLAAALPAQLGQTVLLQPTTPNYDGGIALLGLGPQPEAPKVRFGKYPVAVIGTPENWYALVGMPLGKPGAHRLSIDGQRRSFRVERGKYGSSHIQITDKKYTEPPDKRTLQRIRGEQRYIHASRVQFDPGPPPLLMHLPVRGFPVSTPYGFRRYINGELRSSHKGLDIAAPLGTKVYSAAAGKVAVASDLFYTGLTVILVHPAGFTTLYAHLSHMAVRKGQRVKAGELIGEVGSTGRSTGPHLHWGLTLNGELVDPSLLLTTQDLASLGLPLPGTEKP